MIKAFEKNPFHKCLNPDLCTTVPETLDICFFVLQTEWN